MIKFCVEQWDKNKDRLKKELETRCDLNTCNYKDLVELVVTCILNYADGEDTGYITFDADNITEIDNGSYQGTLLYLIPRDTYQPSHYDYLMTCVYYGSCSGCDTLQAIQEYSNEKLMPSQVDDFMTLCKNLITNMIKPYNGGWCYDDRFEEIVEG